MKPGKRRVWKPILSGALREEALDVVESIASELREPPARPIASARQASLANGCAGLALLFAYLSRARPGGEDRQAALDHLELAMNAAAEVPMGSGLYDGLTGIAWLMAHLRGWIFDPEEDATEAVDTLILDRLRRGRWTGSYDLIDGLAGFGNYALEQMPGATAVECLTQVVNRLDELAERTSRGVAWFTRPELLPDWQCELCPKGHYNLGMAHGVPGVIAFLARVCSRESDQKAPWPAAIRAKARALVEGGVAWLLAQKCVESDAGVFPCWNGPGTPPSPSRVAWCYGDLGIVMALLGAARSLGVRAWEREALWLARRVNRRPVAKSGVRDCGLCHGAAGVGHLFNRLFQATREVWLKEAATRWFRRALRMRRPGRGIAGFAAYADDSWVTMPGLLNGTAGIALAFLAAATPIEPAWDRLLLLSIPGRDKKNSHRR